MTSRERQPERKRLTTLWRSKLMRLFLAGVLTTSESDVSEMAQHDLNHGVEMPRRTLEFKAQPKPPVDVAQLLGLDQVASDITPDTMNQVRVIRDHFSDLSIQHQVSFEDMDKAVAEHFHVAGIPTAFTSTEQIRMAVDMANQTLADCNKASQYYDGVCADILHDVLANAAIQSHDALPTLVVNDEADLQLLAPWFTAFASFDQIEFADLPVTITTKNLAELQHLLDMLARGQQNDSGYRQDKITGVGACHP